jgi:hypothetical protein
MLVIGRRTRTRVVVNFNESLEIVRSHFRLFEVTRIYFEDLPMGKQIEAAHQGTVMIGVHGSGWRTSRGCVQGQH